MKIPLFDIDGTLFKSGGKLHSDAFKHAFKHAYGIEATKDDSGTPEGRVDRQIIFEVMRFHGLPEEKIKEKIDIAISQMTKYFTSHKKDANPQILPGVKELLLELRRKKFPIGLLTGNLAGVAWTKVEIAGIKSFFDFGAFGDKTIKRVDLVEKARLEAEIFLKRNVKKEELAIIGDTPRDIQCARDAGIEVLVVPTGTYSFRQLEEESPNLLLHSLEEKGKVLKFLNN